MVVQLIKNKPEFDEAIASHENVIIDFTATWCGPCRVISPIFEKLSESGFPVSFFKIDVDEVPDVTKEVGVRAMPTFIYFRKGEKVDQIMGADPVQLTELVKRASN